MCKEITMKIKNCQYDLVSGDNILVEYVGVVIFLEEYPETSDFYFIGMVSDGSLRNFSFDLIIKKFED